MHTPEPAKTLQVASSSEHPNRTAGPAPRTQVRGRPYARAIHIAPTQRRTGHPSDTTLAGLPSPEQWAQQIAVAVVDVISGRKDPRSLQRWMTADVYGYLRASTSASTSASRGRGGSLPALAMTSRICPVSNETFEFAVTVWDQNRARAVAGRLVRLRDRWQLCELETH